MAELKLGDLGAAAGAVIVIVGVGGELTSSGIGVSLGALGGALVTATAIYLLSYRNGLSPYRLVLVGIGIDSLAGTHVWSSNTKRNGQLIGRLDGPATVELTIPSLPLLEGVYDLTVTLMDHTEVHPYDYWDKRIRFEVRQYRAYDAGLVHIPGTWSVTGAKAMLQSNL